MIHLTYFLEKPFRDFAAILENTYSENKAPFNFDRIRGHRSTIYTKLQSNQPFLKLDPATYTCLLTYKYDTSREQNQEITLNWHPFTGFKHRDFNSLDLNIEISILSSQESTRNSSKTLISLTRYPLSIAENAHQNLLTSPIMKSGGKK